ncbi:hypothetical protein HUT18_00340 [Streptomyces sp. NA04227]|uniref:alpha/beta fold hydrolase n=1 Tax=Streptomyces sp. NA04227 TaxID=2742136 RepID=UPI001591D7B7|nr:alpha/beta fold hydrolase [Streptomyces sp. NA04227]QKW05028.1 hypothetical protein HUT18_00340 [Streptomyces sp. NA04227]
MLEPGAVREEIDTLSHRGYAFSRRTLTYTPPLVPGQALDSPRPVEPLLVLGGAFQDMYSWRRHEPALLAACGTVVTLDLPGWGRADALPPHHGVDFLAHAVREAMCRAGHRRYHVLAASHGALIGHRLAQLCDEGTIASLALTGARSPRPAEDHEIKELGALIALLEAGRIREFAVRTVDSLSDPAPPHRIHRHAAVRYLLTGELSRTPAAEHAKIVTNLQRLTATTLFYDDPLPRTPTLVFTGEHDTLTPVADARALASHYPQGRWTTIPGTDHIAHLQRDDEYTRLVAEHLRHVAPSNENEDEGESEGAGSGVGPVPTLPASRGSGPAATAVR